MVIFAVLVAGMSRGGPAPAGAAEAGVDGDPDDDAGFSAAQTNLFKLVSVFFRTLFRGLMPTSFSHAKWPSVNTCQCSSLSHPHNSMLPYPPWLAFTVA